MEGEGHHGAIKERNGNRSAEGGKERVSPFSEKNASRSMARGKRKRHSILEERI